jgi:hypothetical protein
MDLRNVGILPKHYMELQLIRHWCKELLLSLNDSYLSKCCLFLSRLFWCAFLTIFPTHGTETRTWRDALGFDLNQNNWTISKFLRTNIKSTGSYFKSEINLARIFKAKSKIRQQINVQSSTRRYQLAHYNTHWITLHKWLKNLTREKDLQCVHFNM